jgi:hypothetical protein
MGFRQFLCSDCGGSVGFRSRPRTFTEKFVLPIFLLRPVRCGDCFRRYYRPLTTVIRERNDSSISNKVAA